MKILVDCLLHWENDFTYLFLAQISEQIKKNGSEMFLHPEVDVNPIIELGSLIRLAVPLNFDASEDQSFAFQETMEAMNSWGIDCNEEQARNLINANLAILKNGRIDLVIVWGSTHFRSVSLIQAASILGLQYLVMERGLVPESWIISKKSQWSNLLEHKKSVSAEDLSQIREKAVSNFSNSSKQKYSNFSATEDFKPSKPYWLFLTGQSSGTGLVDDDKHALNIFEQLFPSNNSELDLLWRGHPYSKFVPRDNLTNLSGQPLVELVDKSEVLVTHGTNLWVLGALFNKPTFASCISSLPSGLWSTPDELSNGPSDYRLDQLNNNLDWHLTKTHFFLEETYYLAGPVSFVEQVFYFMDRCITNNIVNDRVIYQALDFYSIAFREELKFRKLLQQHVDNLTNDFHQELSKLREEIKKLTNNNQEFPQHS